MHFKATEPARQPTFATEKNDRKREAGTAGRNRRRKAAIKGEDGKKGCLPAAGAKKEGHPARPVLGAAQLFFLAFPIRFLRSPYRREQAVETNRRGESPRLRGIAQSCAGHGGPVVVLAVLTFHLHLIAFYGSKKRQDGLLRPALVTITRRPLRVARPYVRPFPPAAPRAGPPPVPPFPARAGRLSSPRYACGVSRRLRCARF